MEMPRRRWPSCAKSPCPPALCPPSPRLARRAAAVAAMQMSAAEMDKMEMAVPTRISRAAGTQTGITIQIQALPLVRTSLLFLVALAETGVRNENLPPPEISRHGAHRRDDCHRGVFGAGGGAGVFHEGGNQA